MVSDWLGGAAQNVMPSYEPKPTTWTPSDNFGPNSPLGSQRNYSPEIFGTRSGLDYTSIFGNAAQGMVPGAGISGGGGGGIGSGVRSSARLGGGGGGGYAGSSQQTPIDFYKGPAPTLQDLNLDYQEMGRRALEANTPYKQQYEQMNPGLYAGLKSMGQLANQQLSGQIPLDVAQQIGRSSAAAKLGAGISNSNLGRNLTARDLGLSSLQVQQSGADLLARSSALTQQAMQAMNPISPNQVFDTASSQASYNTQIANQNLLNAWQTQGLPGQFDITKGQYVGYQPGTYSKYRTPQEAARMEGYQKYEKYSKAQPGRYKYNQFTGSVIDKTTNRKV